MKKSLSLFLLSLAICGQAQVTLEKDRLVKDGQTYSFSKYKDVFESEEAKQIFKKAKVQNTPPLYWGVLVAD